MTSGYETEGSTKMYGVSGVEREKISSGGESMVMIKGLAKLHVETDPHKVLGF